MPFVRASHRVQSRTDAVKPTVPSEDYEQSCFVQWLASQNYMFSSIPNSTFTRSYAVKAKNTRTGLRPGLPDMLIVLKCSKLLWIEMKRPKPGRSSVSAEQKLWQEALNRAGTEAKICYGFLEAKNAVLVAEGLL